MRLDTLNDLFLDELRDLYSAERQLVKALPKMAKAAATPALKAAFEKHLKVTRGQVERLDRVFDQLGASPRGKKCRAMEGLIEEGQEIMAAEGEPSVTDAALIGAAQKVEHYEMAGYGCVRTYARQLGHKQVANWLQKTLDEEGEADQQLTALAENLVNVRAEAAEGRDGEDGQGIVGKVKGAAEATVEKVGDLVTSAAETVTKAVTGKRSR